MAAPRVLVTGGNQGIGFALCGQLLSEHGCHVYLCSRSRERGDTAVEELKKEHPAAADRLELVVLDVGSDESVAAAAADVKERLGGETLYAIVNNAGVGFQQAPEAETLLNVNLYGVKRVTEAFVPLLDPAVGRIVNVGSGAGPMFLEKESEELKRILKSPDVTWEQIEEVVRQQLAQPESATDKMKPYGFSKAAMHAYTMVTAKTFPNLKISVVSPGFIDTQLTRGWGATKTPAEGTLSIKHCLFQELAGSGYYYGSDAVRSPLDRYREPGAPAYTGE